MKTRELTVIGVLLSLGFVLHSVMPPIFFMKPDMLLTMMVLGIVLFPKMNSVLLIGVGTGIISALTTGFPGGQIPNLIEKPITALIIYLLILLLKKYKTSYVVVSLLTAIGTIVSGIIFLFFAFTIANLPAPFMALFLMVVLPTTLINTIIINMILPVVKKLNLIS